MDAALRRGTLADELRGLLRLPIDAVDIERIAPATFVSMFRDAHLLVHHNPGRLLEAVYRQYAMWHDMQPHYCQMQRVYLKEFFS